MRSLQQLKSYQFIDWINDCQATDNFLLWLSHQYYMAT